MENPMIERTSAWKHGYNDYYQDKTLVNPYHYHTEEYYEWERGNLQGKIDEYNA